MTESQPEWGIRLTHTTLRDATLLHQVVFIRPQGTSDVMVSCNCRAYTISAGGVSHKYMGSSTNLDRARQLYNNPHNHDKPFTAEWRAKW